MVLPRRVRTYVISITTPTSSGLLVDSNPPMTNSVTVIEAFHKGMFDKCSALRQKSRTWWTARLKVTTMTTLHKTRPNSEACAGSVGFYGSGEQQFFNGHTHHPITLDVDQSWYLAGSIQWAKSSWEIPRLLDILCSVHVLYAKGTLCNFFQACKQTKKQSCWYRNSSLQELTWFLKLYVYICIR